MAPKNKAEFEAYTQEDVKPTEAHISLANFLTANGPVEVSPEQAWTFIMGHRIWQGSEERAVEKEALRNSRSVESEEKKAAREAAKLEKEADKARKAEEREAKKAAKAAKKAEDDSDLEDEEGLNEETAEAPKKRRRRKAVSATGDEIVASEPETTEAGEF